MALQTPTAAPGAAPGRRLKGITLSRPFVYGNVASKLAKPIGDHTHRWTVLLSSPTLQPLPFIQKVIFALHDTYPNPKREIKQHPFEVTETGWGEFDIAVTVHFLPEMGEKPVTFYHRLKLHDNPSTDNAGNPSTSDQTTTDNDTTNTNPSGLVNSWYLDEFIFADPTEVTHDILSRLPPPLPDRAAPLTFDCTGGKVIWPSWSHLAENMEIDMLNKALLEVERQCDMMKAEMGTWQSQVSAMKKEAAMLEQELQHGRI